MESLKDDGSATTDKIRACDAVVEACKHGVESNRAVSELLKTLLSRLSGDHDNEVRCGEVR